MGTTREKAKGAMRAVLDAMLDDDEAPEHLARLTLNHTSPIVQRLAASTDRVLIHHAVRLLYVQALLLGHHPLRAAELEVQNEGLLGIIAWGTSTRGGAP
jgi:molecular chaperone HtpG